MNPIHPSHRVVWFLDLSREFLNVLICEAQNDHLLSHLETFESATEARQAIEKAQAAALFPWCFVSDGIGIDASISGGHSIVQLMRTQSPLTMILLHSFQADDHPARVTDLIAQRTIDSKIPKGAKSEPLATIYKWLERWNREVPKKVRQYIATCSDPEAQFFPDEVGSYLSLIDLHREMIAGTEIGLEAEQAWDTLLASDEATGSRDPNGNE